MVMEVGNPRTMTYDKKNIDTPRGPRPAKTPVPGKIIIPSVCALEFGKVSMKRKVGRERKSRT